MPYDELIAMRARALLSEHNDIRERKMFGGIAFKLGDHMFGGVVGPDLVVRLGDDAALADLHVRPMDFTGRPLKGIFFVAPAGLETDAQLRLWLERAIAYVRTLPAKQRTK